MENIQQLSIDNWTRWDLQDISREDRLWFETVDVEFWYWFQQQFWWLFWIIVAVYWIGVYFGQHVMKNRAAFENITGIMVTYDILVTLFSIVAIFRISPSFIPTLVSDGFYKSLCIRGDVTEKEGFWLIAFGWSKVAHLLDSCFLVLKKRPVNFLQMYHHSLVVLLPQHILPYGEPILYWWGLTNLIQHAITYPFFACKALKIKLPKLASTTIVVAELVQMLIGLGTGLYTLYIINSGGYCVRHPKSIKIFNFVYLTMGILVARMALAQFKGHRSTKSGEKIKVN